MEKSEGGKVIKGAGNFITNPATGRLIRIGGHTWTKCVRDGIINSGNGENSECEYEDPRDLGDAPEDPDELKARIKELNKQLPRGKQAVRGRGKFKGKLITRNKQPDTADMQIYTAKAASKVVRENLDTIIDSEDIDKEIEKLIMAELSAPKAAKPKLKEKKKDIKYVIKPKQAQEYVEEEDDEFENDEGDDADNDEYV